MPSALEKIKEEYLTMEEMCALFGISKTRLLDRVSLHKSKGDFMESYKVSAGNYLFNINAVKTFISKNKISYDPGPDS